MNFLSMMVVCRIVFLFAVLIIVQPAAADACGKSGVWVQVLGSGGPETGDKRASSGYLVWRDGKARFLIDLGGGSMLRFEQSGAMINDIEAILLTHLHVDHSADLPVLIKSSFFSGRDRDLPVYGPTGNTLMPSMTEFVQALFGRPHGAYRYLSGYLDGADEYRLLPHDIDANGTRIHPVMDDKAYKVSAVPVHHGSLPALAWRIDVDGRAVVFSGDMNGDNHTLEKLAEHADVLVAHHAIPEQADRIARNLHMPPSVIGRIASDAKVKKLVLSHRMTRTFGREGETLDHIAKHYSGPVVFADDLQCF